MSALPDNLPLIICYLPRMRPGDEACPHRSKTRDCSGDVRFRLPFVRLRQDKGNSGNGGRLCGGLITRRLRAGSMRIQSFCQWRAIGAHVPSVVRPQDETLASPPSYNFVTRVSQRGIDAPLAAALGGASFQLRLLLHGRGRTIMRERSGSCFKRADRRVRADTLLGRAETPTTALDSGRDGKIIRR